MPSNQWKQDNPKISGHIPKPLKDQLDQFITDQGLSGVSEALRIILENHFNQSEFSTSSQLLAQSSQPVLNLDNEQFNRIENKIDKVYNEIQSIKIRTKDSKVLNLVENSTPKSSQPVLNSTTKSSQPVPNRSQLTIFDGWLTTGEAYTELEKRGYDKSLGTFRRTLRDSGITAELEELGLEANFEVRNAANPKDNSVRWLKVQ